MPKCSPHPFARPREVRLCSTGAFREVREKGISARGKFFRLSVFATGGEQETALGIITSRKVGIAVARVGVRRKLREIHRMSRGDLRRGLWIVVIAYREATQAAFGELHNEWLRLGRKLSIFATK